MVSLIDIGNSASTVKLRGHDVSINGLTASHISDIFVAFPEIRRIMTIPEGGSIDPDIVGSLIARLPEAIGMIIAAGCGHPNDSEYIEFAQKLGVGEQYLILEAIVMATFPQGVKSFLDGVQALVNQSGARGWAADMKLPGLSKDASQQDDQNETAGTAPRNS